MPRKRFIRDSQFPYHVVNRSNDRKAFPLDLSTCWNILTKNLNDCRDRLQVKIHAFVLMPNHYHLLITTPGENLDSFMRDFQSKTSRRLSFLSGGNGHRFESRYKWSLVKNEEYYQNCVRYIYQNPINGNLENKLGTYPFSSWKEAAALGESNLKIDASIFTFEKIGDHPDWYKRIAAPFHPLSRKILKSALRKSDCHFSFSKVRCQKRLRELQQNLFLKGAEGGGTKGA